MINVVWGDALEKMADRLFADWETHRGGNPFARTCIIVGDMATRNWLKEYFLLKRGHGRRRVLAGIDFKPLAEFVNDWLAAVTHDGDGVPRRPSEHPYSQGVLAWRIYDLLGVHRDDPEFEVLTKYIDAKNGEGAERRRYALSVRLAQLFDDYLSDRYTLLSAWESGELPKDSNRWQGVLYHLLLEEN